MTVNINRSRGTSGLTIRQRRRQQQTQDDLRKLQTAQRKKALLTAKDARKPIPAYTGAGRDNAPAAGGVGSGGGGGGTYTSTDGLFTFFHAD